MTLWSGLLTCQGPRSVPNTSLVFHDPIRALSRWKHCCNHWVLCPTFSFSNGRLLSWCDLPFDLSCIYVDALSELEEACQYSLRWVTATNMQMFILLISVIWNSHSAITNLLISVCRLKHNPGMELRSPALQVDSLPTELRGKPPKKGGPLQFNIVLKFLTREVRHEKEKSACVWGLKDLRYQCYPKQSTDSVQSVKIPMMFCVK